MIDEKLFIMYVLISIELRMLLETFNYLPEICLLMKDQSTLFIPFYGKYMDY